MKPRLIVVLASISLAATFSYQAQAQLAQEPPVAESAGEKGGINLNRLRDDPGDPLELMNTDEPVGEDPYSIEDDVEMDEHQPEVYDLYDAGETRRGTDNY